MNSVFSAFSCLLTPVPSVAFCSPQNSLAQTQATDGKYSLRGKRLHRDFHRFAAFFAFWPRENWGKRNKHPFPLPTPSIFCARPNFRAAQKRKKPRTGEKTYGNAYHAG